MTKGTRMISPAVITWIYRVMVGLVLLHVLDGTMRRVLPSAPPHAGNQQKSIMEIEYEGAHHEHHPAPVLQAEQWEGSPEGMAYSEFNHGIAGVGVILVGVSELRTAIGWQALAWLRWMLPVSLMGSGIFLLIWSDHDAWPIGSLTMAETLSGNDWEILQHKILGIVAFSVGIVEGLLRAEKISHLFWRGILPGFAVVSGLMLFVHMHGTHPNIVHIQAHHHVIGSLATAGGLAWFAGEWRQWPHRFRQAVPHPSSIMKILWALCVFIIGVQLLMYSES